jgi:hypothetical protein
MSDIEAGAVRKMAIGAFRRLPATVVAALALDYPDGDVPIDAGTIAKLINGYKARPGDVAAILTTNAPSGVRRLFDLARKEVLGTPMPSELAAAIGGLDRAVANFTDHAYPQISFTWVEDAFLNAMEAAKAVYNDAETRDSAIWYWTAVAFCEVAIARATLHATSKATHAELALLVDLYCDCLGDYRQFFEEFPYDDGPNARTVAVVAGLIPTGGAA